MSSYPHFNFEVIFKSSTHHGRIARLTTPHGNIDTPAFIFCATKAAVKGASPYDMKSHGTQIILSNTYHLMLQPGGELIEQMGGLHKFMGWDGPMLTDSGGYQIFSLGHGSVAEEIKGSRKTNKRRTLRRITEEAAEFQSYIDGRLHILTPEKSIQIQRQLGADLVVVLDECTPFHVEKSYTRKSMEMSHRWALRSLDEFNRGNNGHQALYGIIQGGIYPDLRKESCEFVNTNPFFGHAVGGCLGKDKQQMHDIVDLSLRLLRLDRPVHLLGIGNVSDIFHGVQAGIDTFDCVHPTRLARHGGALVKAHYWQKLGIKGREHINLRNQMFRSDPSPIDEMCLCSTCKTYSRAYLHHLLKANELLAVNALTLHNVFYMNMLMQAIRLAILEERLMEERKKWLYEKM